MQNGIKRKAILVSHTHWDRAWYLTFEEFRYRLVGMIDRILSLLSKDDSFRCFVLDGQTILIDDYLEIRPENASLLKELISKNKLIIGPWYILPDLFLVSGESIIRNLQIGNKMAKEYGGRLDVGYVPDPFGHIAQLPQILKGFDISTFIFMRGMPKEVEDQNTLLFNWVAPNDDSVLAYNTKDGYLNASNLGYTKEIGRFDCVKPDIKNADKKIEQTLSNLGSFHPKNLFLLNNGMDHMPEQPEIPELLRRLNKENPDLEIQHGSFSDFMQEAQKVDTEISYTGNLLGNEDHPILLNVYSTRVYLKQQNQKAQSMLEGIAEPVSVIANDLVDFPIPDSFLNHAWKTLLKNHPHDDICGCSADGVHQDNEVRFRHVIENSNNICVSSLEGLCKSGFNNEYLENIDGRFRDVFVFNPHPFPKKNEWVEATVVFPNKELEEDEILPERQLKAFDENGNELGLNVLSTQAPFLKAEFIQFTWGRLYKLSLKTDLPATGYKLIRIVETDLAPKDLPSVTNGLISNEHYEIRITGTGLHVTDKKHKIDFPDFITFEYTRDDGDTYSYSKASEEIYSTFINAKVGSGNQTLKANYSIEVPKNLGSRETITIPIKVHVDLFNKDQLSIQVSYENVAENGRLRVLLPIGFKTDVSHADGHFMIYEHTKRPVIEPEKSNGRYEKYPGELNYTTNFQNDFCFAKSTSHITWIANKGLNEYELIEKQGTSYFAVTLHRAVGYLSVSNGSIRRPHAGPKIPTPEAQCLRQLSSELSWGTSKSDIYAIVRKAKAFAHPVYVRELPVLHNLPQEGPLPRQKSYLKIEDPRIQLSAFKPLSHNNDIILRVYNISDDTVSTAVNLGFDVECYVETNMLEQWVEGNKVSVGGSSFDIEVKPHQILTLRLRKQK